MQEPSRFTVLLGGPIAVTPLLLAAVAGSRSVAADGGMAHARPLGLVPELWVGDFDSTPAGLAAEFAHVPKERHPVDKDRTDGEIAIEAAIARGARTLTLVGGLGGQTDHMLGHLALLLALSRRGIRAFATSGREEAYPLADAAELDLILPTGCRLSLIAFSDLEGLSMSGVRWPLANADIAQGSTRTLSNVAGPAPVRKPESLPPEPAGAGRNAIRVALARGCAILLASPDGH